MSLRSSFTKLVGSFVRVGEPGRGSPNPSGRDGHASRWSFGVVGALGAVAVLGVGSGACNNSEPVQCDANGNNCMICDGYSCRPATQGTTGSGGSGGAGGASSTTSVGTGGNGTGGVGTTTTASTSTSTSSGAGGTGGFSTVGDLACSASKPCPSPQVCLPDGYCAYACTSLNECKLYDNRFTACAEGYCEE